jgi:ech hydrogenase subunit A
MILPIFLILASLAVALLLLFIRGEGLRKVVVITGFCVVFAATLGLFRYPPHEVQFIEAHSFLVEHLMTIGEILLAVWLIVLSIKNKKYSIVLLVLLQALPLLWFEHFGRHVEAGYNIFVDRLSIVVAVIVGIIGGLICLYSLGYMRDFHSHYHKEVKDRQPLFFFLLFVFLSAMFGVVFSNNLRWLYFFWEITTVCSFLLIGYKQSEESDNNAFLALKLNLLGGLGFAWGLIYLQQQVGMIELDKLMVAGKAVVILPVMLLCIAGLAKSAQMPFSSWLLGAMVAPTPVSALLHSSAMVKAGVYLVLRFAYILNGTMVGFMIALIGAVTFLVASFIAISQSDAKKVLAYSTIANLGLIILCAGIGTYQAVWAAVLLIIFHAVAKCLLFLCVGVVEHKIHSRNIDDMSGLIVAMPKLSIMMQLGMAGMFLAPFGMLISKWAVLQALVDYNPILAVFLVYGSAATLFYWVKWMGRLLVVTGEIENVEESVSSSEWFPLMTLSFLTVLVCLFFPVIASFLVKPYVEEVFSRTVTMGAGDITIMTIMMAMVAIFPLSFIRYGKNVKVVDAYLGGGNTPQGASFHNSLGASQKMEMKSFYLDRYFGEKRLMVIGVLSGIALLVAGLVFCL